MISPLPFDLDEVQQRLGTSIHAVTPLQKGNLNTKFVADSSAGRCVIKVYPDHRTFISSALAGSHRAEAEFQALSLCRSQELPAPLPLLQHRAIVVMSYLPGVPVQRTLPFTDDLRLIVDWLSRFHSIPLKKTLVGIELPNLHLLAARRNLERHLATHPTDAPAIAAQELLSTYDAPTGAEPSYLHGDPTIGNWLLVKQQVHAVDFEFFTVGNVCYDLGLLLASLLEAGQFTQQALIGAGSLLREYEVQRHHVRRLDLAAGLLCGLLLIATSVPQAERREAVLTQVQMVMNWLGEE